MRLVNSNMPQADTGVDISGANSATTDTSAPQDVPDPGADSLLQDLAGTNAELDAALGGG
jgi:hypothetical protein